MSEVKHILDIDYMHKLANDIKASNSEAFIENRLKYVLNFYSLT